MISFPDYSKIPMYKVLRDNQKNAGKILDDENTEPITFNNILSDEELLFIKNKFKNLDNNTIKVKSWGGQGVINGDSNIFIFDGLIDRVQRYASDAYGEELEVIEVGPVRYSPDYGWEVKLGPHHDTKAIQTFVFDLQISATEDWDIIVEGKNYKLNDGQAVMFSGTNHIHWRENIKLKNDSEVCLIFFVLKHKNTRKFTDEHSLIMKERQDLLIKEVGIDYTPQKIYSNKIDKNINNVQNILKYVSRYANIFTEIEIKKIYESLKNNVIEDRIEKKYGKKISLVELPAEIKSKLVGQMELIYNCSIVMEDSYFIRYSPEYGGLPALLPHRHSLLKGDRLSLSVQLKSNIDWPLIVDGISYRLVDNEGLSFSGTHQEHWRDKMLYKNNNFVEVLLCNFSFKQNEV